jgi:SAM-dependent methyltransferase
MNQPQFDAYRGDYEQVVDRSISFSGLPHDFFMAAKADLLEEIASEHLGNSRTARLLDVGCGVGRLHPHLRGRFASLDGCDVSTESLARAAADNRFVRYAESSETLLPYADGAFDLVVTSCVMHHVPPERWPAFSAEVRRVTRAGGIAVVIEHNKLNPLTRLAVARCPFDADAVLLRPRQVERLLTDSGFSSAESRHFLLLPSARPAARGLERAFARLPFGAQYATIGSA